MSTSTELIPSSGAGEELPKHKPYIADDASMPEFTISALLLGSGLGLVFAASSLYLVLKVGMTVSASIPVAVLAITLFRAFSKTFGLRQATILENNIVQTSGSAGESIAFGVGVTMPALLILGFEMDVTRVMVVSLLGGLLGILAMIPLRRAFIVRMHGRPGQPGTLLYPEGTACAQVLISGEKGGTTGKTVFIGFGIAFAHQLLTEGTRLLRETVALPLRSINRAAEVSADMASAMLGVGYIIGVRTASVMIAGAFLGYLVIIPLIAYIGDGMETLVPPGQKLIREMGLSELRNNYLLYIGAGCVATAGIISMARTLPMIVRSIRAGMNSMRGGGAAGQIRRTEDDMPMGVVLLGSLGLIVLLAVFLAGEVGVVSGVAGALLVVLFGFLFVTVSARLTGEIGSSSNPISGMTVATLTMTCLIFLALGWRSSSERVLALSIAGVVCVAASNGGTTAQSLKTGFLVGGTPRYMQYAILIGALTSALVIGFTLLGLNAAGTVYSKKPENLPTITFTEQERAKLTDKVTHEGKTYLVFDTRRDYAFEPEARAEEVSQIKSGRYLIDPGSGTPAFLKDDAIMGRLEQDDNGNKVRRDFPAPKTQVMGIIIDGVLSAKLNWTLILIGAVIAAMLELCGISALAFAVGLYVPISVSAPIWVGGCIRWAVDRYMAQKEMAKAEAGGDDPEARAQAEIEAIRKSETSPGVLMAAGYIAGGSLMGMLLAFSNFSEDIKKTLKSQEFRTRAVQSEAKIDDLLNGIVKEETGLDPNDSSLSANQKATVEAARDELDDVNAKELARWARVPKGATIKLTDPKRTRYTAEKDMYLGEIAEAELKDKTQAANLLEANKNDLIPHVKVPKGTKLRLKDYDYAEVEKDTTLGEYARTKLKKEDQALVLWARNKKTLSLPDKTLEGIDKLKAAEQAPEGTVLSIPRPQWPSLVVFLLLAGFLAAVGMGKLLKSPEEEKS